MLDDSMRWCAPMKTLVALLWLTLLPALGLATDLPGAHDAWNLLDPGSHDDEVRALLRSMTEALPLRTTTLREIAPAFIVEKQEGLTWEQAVADADRRIGAGQPERALFLRKYLTVDSS